MFRISTKVIVFACMAFCFYGAAMADVSRAGLVQNQTPTARPSIVAANVAAAAASRGPTTRVLPPVNPGTTGPVYDGTCSNPAPDQLDSMRCTMRYMACLRMDMVCGENFELCDTERRFRTGRMFCESELARCPADTINHMFGLDGTNRVSWTDDNNPANRALCDGEWLVVRRNLMRNGQVIQLSDIDLRCSAADRNNAEGLCREIWNGAAWAAGNAIGTCRRVAEACVMRACRNDPHKCLSDLTSQQQLQTVGMVNEVVNNSEETRAAAATAATAATTTSLRVAQSSLRVPPALLNNYANNMLWTSGQVNAYLRSECMAEIGGNEFCMMVANPGMPLATAQRSVNNQDQIEFQLTYDIIMGGAGLNIRNWASIRSVEWLAAAVSNSIAHCVAATEECVKNTCGRGSMAMCYGRSRNPANGTVDLTQNEEIQRMCQPIVDNNQHCRDFRGVDQGAWAFVWGTGSTVASGGTPNFVIAEDSLNVAQRLSIQLQSAFSEAGKARMRRTCEEQATACVRRECGNDFTRCLVRGARGVRGASDETESTRAVMTMGAARTARTGTDDGMMGVLGLGGLASGTVANDIFSGARAGGFSVEMARGLCMFSMRSIQACQDWFDLQFAEDATNNFASIDSWGAELSARHSWASMDGRTNQQTTCTWSTTPILDEDDNVIGQNTSVAHCTGVQNRIFNELIADVANNAQQTLVRAANDARNQCLDRNRAVAALPNFVWASMSEINLDREPRVIPANSTPEEIDRIMAQDDNDGLFNPVRGLSARWVSQNQSADIWNGFCAAKVTMSSDDTELNKVLNGGDFVRYFSIGDTFICGGWITQAQLSAIDTNVRGNVSLGNHERQRSHAAIWTIAGAMAGGAGGAIGGRAVGNMFSTQDTRTYRQNNCSTASTDDRAEALGDCSSCSGGSGGSGICDVSVITVGTGTEAVNKILIRQNRGGTLNMENCNRRYENLQQSEDCRIQTGSGTAGNRNEGIGWAGGLTRGQLGGTVGALAGAGLGAWGANAAATSYARNANERLLAEKQDAAVAEWFNNVGSRIHCTMNGRRVGSYGDLIEIR